MSRPAELSEGTNNTKPIDVIVGILIDSDGRVLITQRPDGKHMAGAWEFPGGKLNPGEAPLAGLRRELDEELAVEVIEAEPFLELQFRYPDRCVRLDAWWVSRFDGEARSCEGQALRWCDPAALRAADILPADAPLVAAVLERLAG